MFYKKNVDILILECIKYRCKQLFFVEVLNVDMFSILSDIFMMLEDFYFLLFELELLLFMRILLSLDLNIEF